MQLERRGFQVLWGDSVTKHAALKVWSSPNLGGEDRE